MMVRGGVAGANGSAVSPSPRGGEARQLYLKPEKISIFMRRR
jgi:hypothetical protein